MSELNNLLNDALKPIERLPTKEELDEERRRKEREAINSSDDAASSNAIFLMRSSMLA